MPKDYTATKLKDITIRFDIPAQNHETNLYHAARIHCKGNAGNGELSVPIRRPLIFLGTGSVDPWTNNEIYTAVLNYSTLNNLIAAELKAMYIDAINEDPST